MSAQVVRDNRALYDRIRRELAKMANTVITVGIHADDTERTGSTIDNANLGAIHEFGAGNVPERSFLRGTVDRDGSILEFAQKEASDVAHGTLTAHKAANRIGIMVKDKVQRRIRSGIAPALSPQTIERKLAKGAHGGGLQSAAENPAAALIDSGQLINSIDYRVQQ